MLTCLNLDIVLKTFSFDCGYPRNCYKKSFYQLDVKQRCRIQLLLEKWAAQLSSMCPTPCIIVFIYVFVRSCHGEAIMHGVGHGKSATQFFNKSCIPRCLVSNRYKIFYNSSLDNYNQEHIQSDEVRSATTTMQKKPANYRYLAKQHQHSF